MQYVLLSIALIEGALLTMIVYNINIYGYYTTVVQPSVQSLTLPSHAEMEDETSGEVPPEAPLL